MFLYNYIYYPIKKIYDIISYNIRFVSIIRTLTNNNLTELDEIELMKIKNMVLENGAITIKFIQWYISNVSIQSNEKIELIFGDLFDNCPEHNLQDSKDMFYNNFGLHLENIVDMDSLKVIGSGSIGQVYKANLFNGKEVAIKVKHPEVEKIANYQMYSIDFVSSLQKIKFLKDILNLHFDLNDFIENLLLQLEFKNEVFNGLKFYKLYENNHMVLIPKVYYYTNDIIITEFIDGVEMDNLSLYKKQKVGLNFYCFIMDSIMINDFIHGDLHKKNWKVKIEDKKYKLILYDFGICFSTGHRDNNIKIWEAFEEYRVDEIIDSFKYMIKNSNKLTDKEIDELHIKEQIIDIHEEAFSAIKIIYIVIDLLRKKNLLLSRIFFNVLVAMILLQKLFIDVEFVVIPRQSKEDKQKKNIDRIGDTLAYCKSTNTYEDVYIYIENKLKRLKKENRMKILDKSNYGDKELDLGNPLEY